MRLDRDWVLDLIYGSDAGRRFTQDSPVLPDVWLQFADAHGDELHAPADLLLTPHRDSSVGALFRAVRSGLDATERMTDVPRLVAWNQTAVVACLTFDELVCVVLPLAEWYDKLVEPRSSRQRGSRAVAGDTRRASDRAGYRWLARLVGTMSAVRATTKVPGRDMDAEAAFRAIADDEERWMAEWQRLRRRQRGVERQARNSLYQVSVNRKAVIAVDRSTLAVKADAARRLFNIDCKGLGWAVIDAGVDATHPAFRRRSDAGRPYATPFRGSENRTRIVATYDFTRLRPLLTSGEDRDAAEQAHQRLQARDEQTTGPASRQLRDRLRFLTSRTERIDDEGAQSLELRRALQRGRMIDWEPLVPLLEVRPEQYRPPVCEHGTHVAGILAADWQQAAWRHDPAQAPSGTSDIIGMCPDLCLYDLRVLGDNGEGDEFTIMAALQFVRWLNADRENPTIHGVNLSLSIRHDVANFACGRTPVCDECERVVAAGTVVVAAAGNLGYETYVGAPGESAGTRVLEGYRSISITDPGNADGVITVGATHRYQPHTYGVSYFSSRGPTGDGRVKPDLVAPGEKITAPVPAGDLKTMDGTSMAAPHVSGAAALLMARHREFVRRPARIKQVLCATATDLGRERQFQGSGMLDILRALQSV